MEVLGSEGIANARLARLCLLWCCVYSSCADGCITKYRRFTSSLPNSHRFEDVGVASSCQRLILVTGWLLDQGIRHGAWSMDLELHGSVSSITCNSCPHKRHMQLLGAPGLTRNKDSQFDIQVSTRQSLLGAVGN